MCSSPGKDRRAGYQRRRGAAVRRSNLNLRMWLLVDAKPNLKFKIRPLSDEPPAHEERAQNQ
jgi:hypothetical protein